ncbi:hypothetical protein JHW43_009507 [Diplocarpon mali]|nr:hypothetical protein JHW43_009507 [Diplocarpon mali]
MAEDGGWPSQIRSGAALRRDTHLTCSPPLRSESWARREGLEKGLPPGSCAHQSAPRWVACRALAAALHRDPEPRVTAVAALRSHDLPPPPPKQDSRVRFVLSICRIEPPALAVAETRAAHSPASSPPFQRGLGSEHWRYPRDAESHIDIRFVLHVAQQGSARHIIVALTSLPRRVSVPGHAATSMEIISGADLRPAGTDAAREMAETSTPLCSPALALALALPSPLARSDANPPPPTSWRSGGGSACASKATIWLLHPSMACQERHVFGTR